MAASLGRFGYVSRCVFYLILSIELFISYGLSSDLPCAQNCTCDGDAVDCSNLELTATPLDLPVRTVFLRGVKDQRPKDFSGSQVPVLGSLSSPGKNGFVLAVFLTGAGSSACWLRIGRSRVGPQITWPVGNMGEEGPGWRRRAQCLGGYCRPFSQPSPCLFGGPRSIPMRQPISSSVKNGVRGKVEEEEMGVITIASYSKSVPSVWEQAANSQQACEAFLGRLSRLDRAMEGRGGERLGAVGSLCLVWPHPNAQAALSLQPSLCQLTSRMPAGQEVCDTDSTCLCVKNLGHNKLTSIDVEAFDNLPNLRELRLDHNELTSIPDLGQAASKIVSLYLHHNKIRSIDGRRTGELASVETLDLSNNDIAELRGHCFPAGLQIRHLYLSNNKISMLELGALDHLGATLSQIPVKAFQLPRLTQLELNRNRIRLVEGLTFKGLSSLEVLKLHRTTSTN
ncbi:hypothetical protein KUCAC02_029820 [Chaenocephalus aceratus]|uniref:Uncharacterized protein n=1 Tax=Chaenocephalus aceratus TaxID=36190 RepID=A0ACB9XH10_CHAAC|nr:hypothetical protein KUCAC02_029820 [Chaenocephalus aceratus]